MPSRWTPGYSSPITLQLVGPQSWTEVPALLRYDAADPESGNQWPPMPESFLRLATDAAVISAVRSSAPAHRTRAVLE